MVNGIDKKRRNTVTSGFLSLLVTLSLIAPILAGCGGNPTGSASSNAGRPVGGYQGGGGYPAGRQAGYPQQQPQQRRGMSTGQKLAILAGGAALLYLYNKNKNKQGEGANGKYYRSRNGRIYYRDAQGNAVYVTPPQGGIQVPPEVAERYNRAAQSGQFGSVDDGGYAERDTNDYFGGRSSGGGANYGGGSNMGNGAGYGGGVAAPPGPRY